MSKKESYGATGVIAVIGLNVFFNTEILVFLKYYAVFNVIIFLVSLYKVHS